MVRKKYLSIDIGNSKTKLAEVVVSSKSIKVLKSTEIDTPEDSFYDGKITNIVSLKEHLEKAIKENKIKAKRIVFPSVNSEIIVRIMTIPVGGNVNNIKESEVRGIIVNEVEQYLSIDINKYIIDFMVMEYIEEKSELPEEKKKLKFKVDLNKEISFKKKEKSQQGGGVKARVKVVVYPRHISDMYHELCIQLKKEPAALDINSNCINKLIEISSDINGDILRDGESYAFLDIGHIFSNFFVIKDNKVEFQRSSNSAGETIDKELNIYCNIENRQANDVKQELTILDEDESVGVITPSSIMTSNIKEWIQSTERMIQYYNNSCRENPIITLYLYGGGSKIKGISKLMSKSLGIKVESVESISAVTDMDRDLGTYINAIGAAIRR